MSALDRTQMDPAQGSSSSSSGQRTGLETLGEFRLLRLLGEGGMGAVYLAYHPKKKKEFALKVLSDQYATNQNYIDRFYREAKSGALLNHPNIVRGLGVGQDQDSQKHYMVLEYIDGQSAMTLLNRYQHLSVGDAVHIAYDIARGLEHAHSRNIIHRDIKPDNILITRSGVAKLTDLGLAKRTDEVSHLTATHQGFGTPYYMPYEQALNARHADNRSDLYALGATLYHLVTGAVPFAGDSHLDVVEKKDQGEFTPASQLNSAVPRALDLILDRLLARDPRDRYQTASELIVDLERSRLASAVPSFADPDLALQDPLVRERMTTSAQATQPDLEQVPIKVETETEQTTSPQEQIWIIRFEEVSGQHRKLRLTKPQLAHRLREHKIPLDARVRLLEEKQFQALTQHPELRDLIKQLDCGRVKKKRTKPRRSHRAESPSTRSYGLILFLAILSSLLAVSLVMTWLFLKQ